MQIIAIIAILVVGVASFFGGMQYQKSQRGNFAQLNGQNRTGFGQENRVNFRPVNGQIISTDDKSITVKLADGSSKIILVPDSSAITEATSTSKQALNTGKQVMVIGTINSDGSVTASNIQLNPQIRQLGPSEAPRQ